MFVRPIAYCEIKMIWVALDQTLENCARQQGCDGTGTCPLSCWFSRAATGRIVISIAESVDFGAARTIRSALELIHGVESVALSSDRQRAEVVYDLDKVNAEQFIRALSAVGFRACFDAEPGILEHRRCSTDSSQVSVSASGHASKVSISTALEMDQVPRRMVEHGRANDG